MNQENSLVNGSILRSLISFTIPILCAILLQSLYSSADLFIVGNFSTVSNVSGVATGSQLMTLLTALCSGLAMGSTILLGQKIGQEDHEKINPIINNSIMMFLSLAFIVAGVLLTNNSLVVSLLNTPSDAMKQTSNYLFICSMGIPFIFAYNILGSIFRGLGDSKTPLYAVMIACFLNILLDLLFVAVFHMGASGAALATIIAQLCSVLLSLYIVHRKHSFEFDFHFSSFSTSICKQILKLGGPVAMQSVITSFSFLAITVIVNQFGVVYSSAVGLSEKLSGFVMLIPIAFMQSLSVFVAQNFGANRIDRAKSGLRTSLLLSCTFGLIMGYVTFFHGDLLAGTFSNDASVVEAASIYLKPYSFDVLLVPIIFCLTGYFNGCGKTFFVMVQGVVSAICFRVPLAYLLSTIKPISLFTIGLGTPITSVLCLITCIIYYIYIDQKKKKS